jgi:hypothetical protein
MNITVAPIYENVNESKELINRLKAIAERITDHGRIAAKQGVSIDENPWKGFNHEYHIWRRGWIFETNELKTK